MIGGRIINLVSVDSTNIYLNKMLKNSRLDEGCVVVAKEQTAGRGQINNKWESANGENITLSFLLYPDFLYAGSQFMLSKFVALAIFDLLKDYLQNVKIKWPNDIYIGDKKIAGVLIENSLRATSISTTIVGLGININQTEFDASIPNPTSFALETKKYFDIDAITHELFEKLNFRYRQLSNNMFDLIDNEYIKSLYRYGRFHLYRAENEEFVAKITGIDGDGRLCLLDTSNKLRRYAFKEIAYLITNLI